VTQRVRELNRPDVRYGAWDGGYGYPTLPRRRFR